MTAICSMCGNSFTPRDNIFFPDIKSVNCPECTRKRLDQERELEDEKINKIIFKDKMRKMRIRDEFFEKTLENFIVTDASSQEAIESAKLFLNGEIKKIIMLGKNGIGKSHIANAILKEFKGKAIRYTAYELFMKLRESYTFKAEFTEMQFLESLLDFDCLLIEELGRTKGSDAELNFLSLLIDEYHTQGKQLIFTSNKIRMADCEGYKTKCKTCVEKRCFEKYLELDSLSRLSQNSKIITLKGDDWRRKKE